MFGIGYGELVIIFLILILVLGPRETAEVAKKLGRTLRDVNKIIDEALNVREVETETKKKS
ncbi:MAG: twin-arginine translocase TatA/TatE family subunit [Acidilobaceae archaeon]